MLFCWTLAVAVRTVSCSPALLLNSSLVGNDVRKAVVDGWPVQNVIASDIQPGQSHPFLVMSFSL